MLVQNLFLLRSIDLQMREIKRILKRDAMYNCAQVVLRDFYLFLRENPVLLAEINSRMQY